MTRRDFDGKAQKRGLQDLQKRTGKLPKDIGAAPTAAGGRGDSGAPLGGVHGLEVRPCDRLAAPGGCRRDGRPADGSGGAIRGENGLIGCTIGCTTSGLPDRTLGMCDILDQSLAEVQEMLPTSVGAVSS